VVRNEAGGSGGGIYASSGRIYNSIVYFNAAGSDSNIFYNAADSEFEYNCVVPSIAGTGVIDDDPGRHRHAEGLEQLTRLIFVDFHSSGSYGPAINPQTAGQRPVAKGKFRGKFQGILRGSGGGIFPSDMSPPGGVGVSFS